MHLHRKPEEHRTTLTPGAPWHEPPRPPSPQHGFMNRQRVASQTPQLAGQFWARAKSLGLPTPASTDVRVPSKLMAAISNMHSPWEQRTAEYDKFEQARATASYHA